ncbi:MAG: GGDEF domain-containing protein [Gammaproteobacteria bacterium]|nr:GGDEF domain-containing protein [Gammaproteobacteria bacterium]
MKTKQNFGDIVKKHNIVIQLFVLIITLSSLAYYNYITQKHVLEQQLEIDTENIVQAMRASINKFRAINTTLSLQNQIRDISLGLDIFEFRFLDDKGIILNSMFSEEIGNVFQRPNLDLNEIALSRQGKFYTDERDFTSVLAASRPVFNNNKLVGVLDLAIDITEFEYHDQNQKNIILRRMKIDIGNLLSAMAGSISNNLTIFEALDYDTYLENYIKQTFNILQVTIMDDQGMVYASSDEKQKGQIVPVHDTGSKSLLRNDDKPVYRILAQLNPAQDSSEKLLLMIDAEPYIANEKRLLITALATGILIVSFSLLIAYSIYRINLDREHRETIRLEKKVKERTAEIDLLSKTDKLTSLANRMYLDEQLEREFKRASRHNRDLVFLVFDLDHFKRVNDTHGHLGGDAVLREVGKRLKRSLRQTDFVGRYGGEEFVVILPETPLKDALPIAENLRKLIEDTPVIFEQNELQINASIGVADFRPDIHKKFEDIFALSDDALYYSKKNGRNCVTYIDGKKPVIYTKNKNQS